jgi:hypothetical protein
MQEKQKVVCVYNLNAKVKDEKEQRNNYNCIINNCIPYI